MDKDNSEKERPLKQMFKELLNKLFVNKFFMFYIVFIICFLTVAYGVEGLIKLNDSPLRILGQQDITNTFDIKFVGIQDKKIWFRELPSSDEFNKVKDTGVKAFFESREPSTLVNGELHTTLSYTALAKSLNDENYHAPFISFLFALEQKEGDDYVYYSVKVVRGRFWTEQQFIQWKCTNIHKNACKGTLMQLGDFTILSIQNKQPDKDFRIGTGLVAKIIP